MSDRREAVDRLAAAVREALAAEDVRREADAEWLAAGMVVSARAEDARSAGLTEVEIESVMRNAETMPR